jgi:hypothetical protein
MKRVLIASFSTLYAAGMLYWLSKVFLKVQGEFGEEPHLLEKAAGPIHLAAALAFVFVVGMVWAHHVGVALKLKRHRKSGWAIFAALGLLGGSGITILYGTEKLIEYAQLLHPWFGASLLPFLVFHWRKRRKEERLQVTPRPM